MNNTIITSFYRTSVEQNSTCTSYTDANYTPYLQYSLKNWLNYYISRKISPGIQIDYLDIPKDKKLYLGIQLVKDDNIIDLSLDSKNYLEKLIKSISIKQLHWLPLLYFGSDIFTDTGMKIPNMWMDQVLDYINLKSVYQSYISNIGLMVNLSEYPDYVKVQASLTLEVKNKLVDLYLTGTILSPQINVINNWNLNPINDDLYTCTWNNKNLICGFDTMTDFLISRTQGDNTLYLRISYQPINKDEELYLRYLLSIELYISGFVITDFLFTDDGIEISVNDFNTGILILGIIEKVNKKLIDDNDINLIYLPMVNVDQYKELEGGTIYRVDDKERPYVYSNIK